VVSQAWRVVSGSGGVGLMLGVSLRPLECEASERTHDGSLAGHGRNGLRPSDTWCRFRDRGFLTASSGRPAPPPSGWRNIAGPWAMDD